MSAFLEKLFRVATGLTSGAMLAFVVLLSASAQTAEQASLLTVKQVMNALITPATATIWGAYELKSDAEWLAVENAALVVIAAGNLMAAGGAGENETDIAQQADWQKHNEAMVAAARAVLAAVSEKDEAALSVAGNDQLYPPCESCHQQYQVQ